MISETNTKEYLLSWGNRGSCYFPSFLACKKTLTWIPKLIGTRRCNPEIIGWMFFFKRDHARKFMQETDRLVFSTGWFIEICKWPKASQIEIRSLDCKTKLSRNRTSKKYSNTIAARSNSMFVFPQRARCFLVDRRFKSCDQSFSPLISVLSATLW